MCNIQSFVVFVIDLLYLLVPNTYMSSGSVIPIYCTKIGVKMLRNIGITIVHMILARFSTKLPLSLALGAYVAFFYSVFMLLKSFLGYCQ